MAEMIFDLTLRTSRRARVSFGSSRQDSDLAVRCHNDLLRFHPRRPGRLNRSLHVGLSNPWSRVHG